MSGNINLIHNTGLLFPHIKSAAYLCILLYPDGKTAPNILQAPDHPMSFKPHKQEIKRNV